MAIAYITHYFIYFDQIVFDNLTKSEIFYTCFNAWNNPVDFPVENEKIIDSANLKVFDELLKRYEMQDYYKLLLNYQNKWFFYENHYTSSFKIARNRAKEIEEYLSITQLLKIFYSGKSENVDLRVSLNKSKSASIKNEQINSKLKEIIEAEFKKLNLNDLGLSYSEAKSEILSENCDLDWFDDLHMNGYFTDFYDGIHFHTDKLTDYIVFWYAREHYKTYDEIDLNLINKLLENLEYERKSIKLTRGIEPRYKFFVDLCLSLSYLHRFKFFMNQTEKNDILELKLFSETNIFIYDYLDFWGLIPKDRNSEFADNVEKANYIKTIIQNEFSKRGKGTHYSNELKINILFGIKQNLVLYNKYDGIFVEFDVDHPKEIEYDL